MTTGACSFPAPFSLTSANSSRAGAAPLVQVLKLGRLVTGFSAEPQFHGSLSCFLVAFGRTTRRVDVRCSPHCMQNIEADEVADELSAMADRQTVSEGDSGGEMEKEEEGAGMQVRLQVEDLRIGAVFKGKVCVVESYGVFVNFGAPMNGFVHISRLTMMMRSSSMRRVEDVVQVGQDVTVQIVDLDPRAEFISLLLITEPQTISLQPLALTEQEILDRAVARRAYKISRCSQAVSRRRLMSLETRQRLKTHSRVLVAERQAFHLHQVRSKGHCFEAGEIPVVDGHG